MVRINQSPGLGQPFNQVFPKPIVSNRSPLTSDTRYPLGTTWVNKSSNEVFFLSSVSAGSATWVTGSAQALTVNTQVITATGTYTPSGVLEGAIVEAVGGGGAGGGAGVTAAGQFGAGGGGGSGEYARGSFTAAQIGSSQSVTIGAAGTGTSGAAGGNGSTTSFGTFLFRFVQIFRSG